MSAEELETVFRDCPGRGPAPDGRFRGELLVWIEGRGAGRSAWRALQWVGFRLLPFGVDFSRRCWYFGPAWVRMGRFVGHWGASRWRDTEAMTMRYEDSRLPGVVRRLLYDEIKPLGPGLCLGIGGINAARGRGDHFFFALKRIH